MTDTRTSRSTEVREMMQRKGGWKQPETLPIPEKEPGMAYRWIRLSTLGEADPRNVAGKLHEGWEPEGVENQPALRIHESQDLRFRGNIEIGGLILCKMPQEFVDQRAAYYGNQTKAQMDAVDNNFMNESDPRMPTLFSDKKSKVTFGNGSI